MAHANFQFSGRTGLVALVVVVLVAGVRIATLGETDDPALHAAVRAELKNKLGGELGKALETVRPSSAKSVASILKRADDKNIAVHSVRVSKPLLSFSNNAKAIVRVEYSMPGINRNVEYWRFDHGIVAGWRYRYGATAVAYFMNFS